MEAAVPDILELRRKNLPANWTDEVKEREMQVPAWLLSVVAKCLEKLPENRYKNGVTLHETIVLNSTSPVDGTEYNAAGIAVLQKENDRLKTLLLQYKEAAEPSGGLTLMQEDATQKNALEYTVESKNQSPGGWFTEPVVFGLKPLVLGIIIL